MIFSFTSHAQESLATINGAVMDPTGSAVAGSKVIAAEVRTGTKVQTISDISGHYTLPFLSTGQYDRSATSTGFKESLRRGIELGAGDHAVIDIRLDGGDTSTLVEVTANAPMLNTDNATTEQAITTEEVEDIPLNGGTPLMLSQLVIGVITTGTPAQGLSVIRNYGFSKLIEHDTWLNDSDPVPEKRVSPVRSPAAFRHGDHAGSAGGTQPGAGHPLAAAGFNRRRRRLTSVYPYQVSGPLVWANGSTTSPGDYVYGGGPGALASSLNNRYTETTPTGTAPPSFATNLFVTNSTNAFAYHLRTFSTTFPNLRQDGLNKWAPSLLKNLKETEKLYVQFRFEFFNVRNHPTFAAPNPRRRTRSSA